MSGGSMNYLYSKLEYASFDLSTPERRAFRAHLQKVAKALHDIEWVDSGDFGPGDENQAIRDCLSPAGMLEAAVEMANEALQHLQAELQKTNHSPNNASAEPYRVGVTQDGRTTLSITGNDCSMTLSMTPDSCERLIRMLRATFTHELRPLEEDDIT